jgi:DNA polymerase-3 subunit delta
VKPAKRYQNAKQFKRELDGDRLERRYLFLGEEDGDKEKCINRIIVMAFDDPADRTRSASRFHVENEEFLPAVDFALSSPLFSLRRVCVMYHVERLAPGRHGDVLGDLLRDLPDSTILIMTSGENRPPAFLSGHLESFKIVQFWRYFENDIHQYIAMSMRRLGLTVDDAAIDLLVERTGNDIKKVDDAIDMLRYSGAAGPVDADTIRQFVDDVRDAPAHEFIDALFKREPRALLLFRKMHGEGIQELSLLYRILRQAEMIEQFYDFVEEGMAADEAMEKAGVYSKNRENFWRYTRQFPRERLRTVFSLIGAADFQLKSGSVPKSLTANPAFELAGRMLFEI